VTGSILAPLFSGHRGVGKTTELLRVGQRVEHAFCTERRPRAQWVLADFEGNDLSVDARIRQD
jgi:hypothetical protein